MSTFSQIYVRKIRKSPFSASCRTILGFLSNPRIMEKQSLPNITQISDTNFPYDAWSLFMLHHARKHALMLHQSGMQRSCEQHATNGGVSHERSGCTDGGMAACNQV